MDLYALAGKLLTVVGGQLSAAGIVLPTQQAVMAGPMPVWDFEMFSVNLVRVFTGAPGAENPVQPTAFTMNGAEFTLSIVRNCPSIDDYGVPALPAKMVPFIVTNMKDVVALKQTMEIVRNNGSWVDHATPMSIGAAQTQGPEGGMLAAVLTVQTQVLQP